jgi:GNAT superfamily N-acetyltransferase
LIATVCRVPELDYVSPANPWQTGELEELQRRASHVWPAYREQLAAHPDAIEISAAAIAAGHVRVAYDENGDTLGFSVTVPGQADGEFELDGLFVDPTEMGLGVGRGLIDDCLAYVRRLGGTRLWVTGGPESAPFYEHLGFTATGPAETRFGPAVRLVREV